MLKDRFKFRLYDKAIGEMVYDVCVGFIKDYGKTDDWVCADTSCGQITYRGDKLKDIVLMQCTGLTDKNGKLIYEGDIIKYLYYNPERYTKWIVVFNPDTLEFGTRGYGYIGYQRLTSYSIFNNKVEVIGNIYEKPELLKDGE